MGESGSGNIQGIISTIEKLNSMQKEVCAGQPKKKGDQSCNALCAKEIHEAEENFERYRKGCSDPDEPTKKMGKEEQRDGRWKTLPWACWKIELLLRNNGVTAKREKKFRRRSESKT